MRALRTAAPILADAFEDGTRTLPRTVALNQRLTSTFNSLVASPRTRTRKLGVDDLRTTSDILRPTIAYLKPAQTVCNYMTLWFRNIASLLSDGDANGTWQRFIIVAAPQGPNNEGGPASKPAAGPNRDNYLHTNPYPNTSSPGQPAECEAGNEQYLPGRTVIGNVPGTQAATAKDEGEPDRLMARASKSKSDANRIPRKDRARRQPGRGRRRRCSSSSGSLLLRLHEVRAVHARLPGSTRSSRTRTRSGKNSPVRDRGRQRRQGHEDRAQEDTTRPWSRWSSRTTALPIHKDATLKIRPRIFLEGNFFVDLQPGTPSAPTLDDGDTLPMTQTASPVQLDEVLTSLQSDTRKALQTVLDEYGSALTSKPTRGRRRPGRPRHARARRRPSRSTTTSTTRAGAARTRRSSTGVPRHRARRPRAS